MKRCPQCNRIETNDTLGFCRIDGTHLVFDSLTSDSTATQTLGSQSPNRELATQPSQRGPSIAVLPFADMSADASNEYFCDGLAEELLNALGKIENLKVAARTSAFSFKGKDVKVSDIGEALNVQTVLEGSVRKSGNRLRITIQLIDAADGYHLWSDRYDREMSDIFDLQDEITLAVVDALKVKLLGEQKAAVLKRGTDNTEAYEFYLKGLYHFNQWTGEGWRKSIECFEKAIEIEPQYAPAYAGIANSYHFISHVGLHAPHEMAPRWKAAALRALEIDPDLAEAHWALADLNYFYEWDWAEAEREYKKAIQLNPDDAYPHQSYGLFLTTTKRFDEALAEVGRALELDPLSPHVNFIAGATCLFADRLDEALGFVRRMRDLQSGVHLGHWLAGDVFSAQGNHKAAVEAFEKAIALGSTQNTLSHLGCVYGLAGRREDALGVLKQLLEMREGEYATAFNIARVYAGFGEADKAFEWLSKAVDERNGELVFLNGFIQAGAKESWGKDFHTDPRYKDILARMGLIERETAQRTAAITET